MSQETLKRLVGALIVALGVWGVTMLASGSGSAPRASGGIADALDALVDTAAVERISFSGADLDAVALVRGAEGWTVDGVPADSGLVVRMLNGMADASLGELAARNAANHARMGLAADSARVMEVTAGGATHDLLVGDQGPGFGTTYVRLPDQDEVHTVAVDLRSHARRSRDDWRSKRILAVDTSAVATLEVTKGTSTITLQRADSAWTFADGSPADGSVARSLLGELRDLRADGFLTEGDSLAAAPETGRVVARDRDGTTLADVSFGGEDERWARAPGASDVFRIASYRMDRLLPTRERATPPEG